MIELLKKYKVAGLLFIMIAANIGWLIFLANRDKPVSVQLNHLSSQSAALSEENSGDLFSLQKESVSESEEHSKMKEAIDHEFTADEIQLQKEQLPAMNLDKILTQEKSVKVPIFICGAVAEPGVYYVEKSAIVNDVVLMSGGFTSEADSTYLNLASIILPNQKIYIPKIGEEIDKKINSYDNIEVGVNQEIQINGQKANGNQNTQQGLININTATEKELQTLSGIGEVKAKAIIEYRTSTGRFKSIDELCNVSGIGSKTLEKIKPFITI